LTVDLVVVFGITTFVGLGGSFLTTGFAVGFIETNDLGSGAPFLPAGFTGGAAGFTSGFGVAFATGAGTGFLIGTVFLGVDLAGVFFDTDLSFFLGAGPPEGRAGFFAAGLARGFLTAFLAGAFLGAGFFLVAILSGFF
jgi:hypothetical protein